MEEESAYSPCGKAFGTETGEVVVKEDGTEEEGEDVEALDVGEEEAWWRSCLRCLPGQC